jgi:hypothetical protein
MVNQNTYSGNSEPDLRAMLEGDPIFDKVARAGGSSVPQVIDLCRNTKPQILAMPRLVATRSAHAG